MLLLVLFLAIVCRCCLAQNAPVTAVTTKGNITGYTLNLGPNNGQLYYGQADCFLKVPYAAKPVDGLRFQKPVEVPSWGSMDGTILPNKCPQNNGFSPNPAQNNSEDCLYMSIFSPNIGVTGPKYPVMFYIHGGGFATGSAGAYGSDGIVRNLVSRGVVVVMIQYRLSVLGFFTTNTTEFPANLGLWDQVQALRFVQSEIGAFGGDKDRVTIFGQSAGSCSVSAHTYSPQSIGLFQRAIMESGTSLLCFDGTFDYGYWSQTAALQMCNFTADQWTSGNYTALKKCMQDVPFEKFLTVKEELGALPWPMSIDGKDGFMPDFPRNLAAQRPANYSNMSIMIGTTRDEWGFWEIAQIELGKFPLANYTRAYSQAEMAIALRFYEAKQQTVIDIINSVYVDPFNLDDSQNVEWLKVISRWHTDAAFEALAAREVDLWLNVNKNPNVYLYRYSYRSQITALIGQFVNLTGWDPVFHAEELYFLFMTRSVWEANSINVTANDRAVADWLGKTWTDFAKTGNLSASWLPVRNDYSFNYLEITPAPTMRCDYGQIARTVFNEVIPKLTFLAPQIPPPMPTSQPPTTTTTTAGSSTVVASLATILVASLILVT